MEARLLRTAAAVICVCALAGADHKTDNFTCNAPTKEIAVRVCESAERFRRDLANEWLGQELPRWSQRCPITVQVGERLGAGGATSFVFDRGEVFGWQMTIQGSLERVLDSVLPHEVTHTIFASHFRQPLPRWADEGACTTVEHVSERTKQQKMLIQFLQTGRGIPFSAMFAMKEYPQDVLPLYAQGHSLTSYLIGHGGKRKFLKFVADGLESDDWAAVLNKHYGISSLGQMQNTWLDWVAQGSPAFAPTMPSVEDEPLQLASAMQNSASPYPNQNAAPIASRSPQAVGKRPRPAPNAVYEVVTEARPIEKPLAGGPIAAPYNPVNASTGLTEIGPGKLVPLTPVAVVATPVPSQGSPSQDPFNASSFSTASRPQHPESARQVILEWSQPPDQPTAIYQAAPSNMPQSTSAQPNTTMRPTGPIFFDATATGGTITR